MEGGGGKGIEERGGEEREQKKTRLMEMVRYGKGRKEKRIQGKRRLEERVR